MLGAAAAGRSCQDLLCGWPILRPLLDQLCKSWAISLAAYCAVADSYPCLCLGNLRRGCHLQRLSCAEVPIVVVEVPTLGGKLCPCPSCQVRCGHAGRTRRTCRHRVLRYRSAVAMPEYCSSWYLPTRAPINAPSHENSNC